MKQVEAVRANHSLPVTVDVVLFTIREKKLAVLLVKRINNPFSGVWALPGGFVQKDESVDEAALRELQEETSVSRIYLEQLYTFGDPERDPRGRVITVSYYALINWENFQLRARTDTSEAKWFPVQELPKLAFDHREIIRYALERLQHKVNYTTICFQLLPKRFALSELQQAYEIILTQKLDKRNFRKKMTQLRILKDTGEMKTDGGPQRPAKLYSFTDVRVVKLQEKGIIVPF